MLNNFDGCDLHRWSLHSPFLVQVHDMSLICMNEGVGAKIGSSLEDLVAMDVARDGVGWSICLRIQIILDLTKPMERG